MDHSMNDSNEFVTSSPAISVVLPVFNAELYIDEAVFSILNQTFKNFELILIDDGSSDGTLDLLMKLKEQNPRIVLVSRENKGIPYTLNEGIRLARGRWIAIMNADDIALPNRFERQLDWLAGTDADICGSWVKYFGTEDTRILKHPQSDEAIKIGLLFGSMFAQPTVMMRTDLVRQLSYGNTWSVAEDYDLWERAARVGWKMANVPEVLLLYRQHKNQISTVTNSVMLELSQKIRFRYWEFVFENFSLNKAWIKEVLKLREQAPTDVDMNAVDSAFAALLKQHQGESRATIFYHMTRLYIRAAADCPDIAARWAKLNREFGSGFGLKVKIELYILRIFGIRPDSALFFKLKKAYFYLRK